MIGLDTNVVVRYLVQDDPHQAAAANRVFDEMDEASPGFLSLVTVVEVYWVLRRAYRVDAARCLELIAGLISAREIRVGQADVIVRALADCREGMEFPDAVIAQLGSAAGCETTVTFDQGAATAGRMRLL